MDVHDVGDYKVGDDWRLLESGHGDHRSSRAFTCRAVARCRKRWRNIGIRIEDDVAVTNKGPDVLSKGLAKTPDEIESLMSA